MKRTVPSKPPSSASMRAAPSNIDVCPSWPHACMVPLRVDAHGAPVASVMRSASMSARSAMARFDVPRVRVPTTPVPPIPVATSIPNDLSVSATNAAVRVSSKPNSGFA